MIAIGRNIVVGPLYGDRVRIGLISDTHMPGARATLWDEIAIAFAGVDLIWHGGDIVWPTVLDELEEIAHTFAARGNNDGLWKDHRIAEVQWLDVEGLRLAMIHDMEPEERPIDELRARYFGGEHVDIIITGHTHVERLDWRHGTLQINSGSATHPHLWSTRLGTVAIVEITVDGPRAEIIRLGESDGLRNPGVAYRFDGSRVERLS